MFGVIINATLFNRLMKSQSNPPILVGPYMVLRIIFGLSEVRSLECMSFTVQSLRSLQCPWLVWLLKYYKNVSLIN